MLQFACKKDVNDIKLKVPPSDVPDESVDTEDTVIDTSTLLQPQKVTILVEEDSWRKLKVLCARNKLKITEQAGRIIKKWVAANAAD